MQNNFFPITFSIPESKIISIESFKNINKKKLLSDLIPGRTETYIYNTEDAYYNEYRESIFAITMKKGGWDCLRHYEIIANGCIPYFINLENYDKTTMKLLPIDLLLDGNKLYEKLKYKNIYDISPKELEECNNLVNKLIHFTNEKLTSKKMAEYILDKIKYKNAKKILYLSGNTDPDYLRCLTLIGFKQLLGADCHDYPKITHIYKSQKIDYSNLYGKGFTYSNIIESDLHNNILDYDIQDDIINKKYDVIIYGSFHRGMPFYDLVSEIFEPNKVILLCGEENHICKYNNYINKGNIVFAREMNI